MDNLAEKIGQLAVEQFSRSGGPGGQNVNKVNTRVTLRIPLAGLGLSAEELQRLTKGLSNRINAGGELIIHSGETRSQWTNRELAIERAAGLISSALVPTRRRKPSKPSKAAREKRLQAKHRRSYHKQSRRRPSRDED